jgi:hypothetical protein
MEIANKHSIKNSQPWLWLTWPLVILLVIAGAVGHFVEDFYHLDSPLLAAQFIGQDLIALVVTVPVLVFSAILAGRGSPRALLVWLGTLIYLVYTYVIYSFCAHFNARFRFVRCHPGLSIQLCGGHCLAGRYSDYLNPGLYFACA